MRLGGKVKERERAACYRKIKRTHTTKGNTHFKTIAEQSRYTQIK